MQLRAAILALTLGAAGATATPNPPRVAVLANADDPQSLALARHYLAARAIPQDRLVALSLPTSEEIDWDTFVTRIRNPLLEQLVQRGMLTGEFAPTPDAEGRSRFMLRDKACDHLVLCKGVPLKIRHDAARFESREKHLPLPPPFRLNQASVDSELCLLPRPATPLAGPIPNPRHRAEKPAGALTRDTLMVARLDGPAYADAFRLIDGALEAERSGLIGRAYIDMGGPHHAGDAALAATAELCRRLFLDTDADTSPALIPAGHRMDAPAFYFGWYSAEPAGALAEPAFRFRPGAVAMHIHSYSALSLRSADTGWTAALVAKGAALTTGNVYEPYLELTHNPELLMRGLIAGMNAGEAAAYAMPALSWQTIVVGDPLYRPFAHDSEQQLADFTEHPQPEHAYTLLRAAAKLDAAGRSSAAETLLADAAPRLPVLALALGRLDRSTATGRRLKFAAADLAPIPEDAGLVFTMAEKLAATGRASEALRLVAMQHALGVRFDARAAAFARSHGDSALAVRLSPPATADQKNKASAKAAD